MEQILITGGSGFLGVSLAQYLLATRRSAQLVLTDLVEHPRLGPVRARVKFVAADLGSPAAYGDLIGPETTAVYHFASLVSGGAEKDFEANIRANIYATLNLLEACRKRGRKPRFVFTSSIATYGGARLPEEIDDYTHQHPQNSYGVAKVIGEQLLNDYSRKDYIDGRGVRLPAIVVRDEPNTAASGYASSMIREAMQGRDYVCPVSPETRIPILSVRRCVQLLAELGSLPQSAMGDYRSINGPNISPSAGEIAAAIGRTPSPAGRAGRISFAPDPAVQKIVAAWPRRMRFDRAAALGLRADASIDDLVAGYAREIKPARTGG